MSLATDQHPTVGAPSIGKPPHRIGLAKGVAWQASTRLCAQVVSWGATLIVARYVSPESYGVMGMSIVVIAFTSLLTEFGIGTTIITTKELGARIEAQLHGLSLLLGSSMTLSVCALAGVLADLYGEPRVREVLYLLSTNFLLAGVSTVPLAILRRDLEYRKVSLLELVRALTTSIAVLLLALAGAEYWALAIGNVVGSAVMAIGVMTSARVRFAVPRRSELGPTLSRSSDYLVGTLAWFGYSNADAVILGKLGGAAALGQFRFATTLASLPAEKLVNVIASVTLPVFSTLKNEASELRALVLDITELIAMVVYPTLAIIALASPAVVPLLFGPQWKPAIPIVQLMCIAACLKNIQVINSQVLSARGRSKELKHMGVGTLLVMPFLFYAGARIDGARGVALAWLIAQPFLFSIPFVIMARDMSLSIKRYADRFSLGMLGIALICAGSIILERMLAVGVSSEWKLVLGAAVGGVVYLCIIAGPRRAYVMRLATSIRKR